MQPFVQPMQDFILTYYNAETLELDSNGVFGLNDIRFFGEHFIPFALEDGHVNPKFLDFASQVESFRCDCIQGSASFRCENRQLKKCSKQYWYGYKKIGGKVRKFSIGDLNNFTFKLIEKAIAVLCGLEKVAQKKSVTFSKAIAPAPIDKPLIELTGNGKSDRHLQPSLISENDALSMAIAECKELKAQNEILVNRIIEATEMYKEQWHKASDFGTALIDCENTIAELEEKLEEKDYAIRCCLATFEQVDDRNQELKIKLEGLEECKAQRDKFGTALIDCENTILDLERKVEYHEDQNLAYGCMYQQQLDDNFEYAKQLLDIKTIIDRYRTLADGKTRQSHPRYNKLLDFIADIDKLC